MCGLASLSRATLTLTRLAGLSLPKAGCPSASCAFDKVGQYHVDSRADTTQLSQWHCLRTLPDAAAPLDAQSLPGQPFRISPPTHLLRPDAHTQIRQSLRIASALTSAPPPQSIPGVMASLSLHSQVPARSGILQPVARRRGLPFFGMLVHQDRVEGAAALAAVWPDAHLLLRWAGEGTATKGISLPQPGTRS